MRLFWVRLEMILRCHYALYTVVTSIAVFAGAVYNREALISDHCLRRQWVIARNQAQCLTNTERPLPRLRFTLEKPLHITEPP